ncbi:MAG: hypothetical protein FJ304_27180 [Planctomycetes bacterium]|nr:hypothetical protein [Planctomycetota bacterium]
MRGRDGPAQRPPLHGQLLPTLPARGGTEPAGATASGDRRPVGDVPVAALPEPARKRYQNARRRHDPLGEGQPATWRLLLIKVAASVVVSCRRIVVRLSGSWPHQQFFERVAQHACRRPAVPHFWTG